MKNYKAITSVLLISAITLSGCAVEMSPKPNGSETSTGASAEISADSAKLTKKTDNPNTQTSVDISNRIFEFSYEVIPETFELSVSVNGTKELLSQPGTPRKVENQKLSENTSSWTYPDEQIEVTIEKAAGYLDITIRYLGEETQKFSWPSVSANRYLLPLGEGKQFSNDDSNWKEYLSEKEINGIESLSMQFFTAQWDAFSAVYLIKNPYDNQLFFDSKEQIKFDFQHEFPNITPEKEYGFQIHLADDSAVSSAKIYKKYIQEQGDFKTLEEKAQSNENITKLYGAPHIYFYPKSAITESDINWEQLNSAISPEFMAYISKLLTEKVVDGDQYLSVFDELKSGEDVYQYARSQIVKAFHSLLFLNDFYDSSIFGSLGEKEQELLNKGIENLTQSQVLELNKGLLASQLKGAVNPVETWAKDDTVDILEDIKQSGLENAWIGLDEWKKGLYQDTFVKKANEMGYLIGPYDSYHSIHEPGSEKWSTAEFSDQTLYDNAAVMDVNGEYLEGFQGEGRKLNPTLAMPSVIERVDEILDNGLSYNSWFIDCDATGEIYNDYAPGHTTTAKQDLEARMERMTYIRDEKDMVIGSEGGNDFANDVIAFAHGIETPAFSWMDPDMNKNKDSEYYMGKYYAASGGTPEVFTKEVPLKEYYYNIFINPKYSVPLYKLVYNDSVITTHQWGWPTTKIKDSKSTRMLKEILYNVPPLYQMDSDFWNENKEEIVSHSLFFSEFSPKVINKEMSDFQILSEDSMVQMTEFGGEIKVIANFSDADFSYDDTTILAGTLKVIDASGEKEYKPLVTE